ncbi:MAG: hypothetical protein NT132_03915 [Microbacterium sp.]|uniref:hypothetical protein n=1 Tax=Microbacterium sp. TaxID=51671 RepID=UPI002613F867|nr:hypothetical protein [Microbacterium sp.]MCX6501545.1 hypothetical protein [Microbacterium sp.]
MSIPGEPTAPHPDEPPLDDPHGTTPRSSSERGVVLCTISTDAHVVRARPA